MATGTTEEAEEVTGDREITAETVVTEDRTETMVGTVTGDSREIAAEMVVTGDSRETTAEMGAPEVEVAATTTTTERATAQMVAAIIDTTSMEMIMVMAVIIEAMQVLVEEEIQDNIETAGMVIIILLARGVRPTQNRIDIGTPIKEVDPTVIKIMLEIVLKNKILHYFYCYG